MNHYKRKKEKPSSEYTNKELMAKYDVGDIVVCTWGNNLIHNDFYKVIDKKKDKFRVRKLKKRRVSGSSLQGTETYYDEYSFDGREIKDVKPSGSNYSPTVYLDIDEKGVARKMNEKEKIEGVWFDYLD